MPELNDSPSLKDRIIAESRNYITTEPNENEFTIAQYMEWNNVEWNTAERALKAMVYDGKLSMRKGKVNGSRCNIYQEKE